MGIRRVVPDIRSDGLDESRGFYEGLLGFELAMDMGWIVTYVSPDEPLAQVSLLSRDATASVVPDMSVEVDDVDSVYREAMRRDLRILHPLTDEPWGVRRFFVEDPNGKVVNVMTHRNTA